MVRLSGFSITYLYRYILLSRRIKKRGTIKKKLRRISEALLHIYYGVKNLFRYHFKGNIDGYFLMQSYHGIVASYLFHLVFDHNQFPFHFITLFL